MMKFLIVLVAAAVFTAVGFFMGMQLAPQQTMPPDLPFTSDMTTQQKEESVQAGSKQLAISITNLKKRQDGGTTGGLIGAGAGLLVGVAIVLTPRRKKPVDPPI